MRISKSTKTDVKASSGDVAKGFGMFSEGPSSIMKNVYCPHCRKLISQSDDDFNDSKKVYSCPKCGGNFYGSWEFDPAEDWGMDIPDDNVKACGDIKASKKLSANEQALTHIKAAIDILGKSGNKDEVTKDSIANLGIVMFDLKSSK